MIATTCSQLPAACYLLPATRCALTATPYLLPATYLLPTCRSPQVRRMEEEASSWQQEKVRLVDTRSDLEASAMRAQAKLSALQYQHAEEKRIAADEHAAQVSMACTHRGERLVQVAPHARPCSYCTFTRSHPDRIPSTILQSHLIPLIQDRSSVSSHLLACTSGSCPTAPACRARSLHDQSSSELEQLLSAQEELGARYRHEAKSIAERSELLVQVLGSSLVLGSGKACTESRYSSRTPPLQQRLITKQQLAPHRTMPHSAVPRRTIAPHHSIDCRRHSCQT